jgi:hypothetical protein
MTKAEEIVDSVLRQSQQAITLETALASDVQLKSIDWLWPNRFALGKLAILAGLPDRGKGLITADMVGRITNPKMNLWPCGEGYWGTAPCCKRTFRKRLRLTTYP